MFCQAIIIKQVRILQEGLQEGCRAYIRCGMLVKLAEGIRPYAVIQYFHGMDTIRERIGWGIGLPCLLAELCCKIFILRRDHILHYFGDLRTGRYFKGILQ
ncbi:hypothetical protein D3C72_501360 [compost metagenome]